MLEPWREALERLDGRTLHYETQPQPGVINANSNPERSILITESVWFKALGDAISDSVEDERLASLSNPYPVESKIDARVAKKVIEALKAYGISI